MILCGKILLDEIFRVVKLSFDEIIKEESLTLVPEASIEDYVMVHVGTAISIIDKEEGKTNFNILIQLNKLNNLEILDEIKNQNSN